jgi:hypothetical protein
MGSLFELTGFPHMYGELHRTLSLWRGKLWLKHLFLSETGLREAGTEIVNRFVQILESGFHYSEVTTLRTWQQH